MEDFDDYNCADYIVRNILSGSRVRRTHRWTHPNIERRFDLSRRNASSSNLLSRPIEEWSVARRERGVHIRTQLCGKNSIQEETEEGAHELNRYL